MNFDLGSLRRRATALLSGFTSGQRAMLGIAALGLIVGGWMFTKWSSAPSYTQLYSGLSAQDASAITQRLTSSGVSYQLSDGGATVLVPRARLYQSRLDLSAAGLPSQGAPGYALLDKQGITTSEFRQRVDYQRALEGELANTISAIQSVDHATVHLVIPKDDLFTKDVSTASASVLVTGRSGGSLTSEQVRAVVHLVASSVEGLRPEAVTVADSDGRVLSAPGSDASAAGDVNAEQTVAYEQRVGQSLETLLSPIVGEGHAVVRVTAKLDFDQRETTSERYGQAAAPVGEKTSKETYTGITTPAAGGALSTTGQAAARSTGGSYGKEIADRSFALDKVTEQVKAAPGGVERLSVAVLLDRSTSKVAVSDVKRLVMAAAGLDTTRGDAVQVTQAAFDRTAADAAAKAAASASSAAKMSQLLGLLRVLGALLIVGAVLFLAYRSARRSSVDRVPLPFPIGPIGHHPGGALPMGAVGESHAGSPSLAMPAMAGLGAGPAPAAALGAGPVTQLLERQPDDVAHMLRSWLADGGADR